MKDTPQRQRQGARVFTTSADTCCMIKMANGWDWSDCQHCNLCAGPFRCSTWCLPKRRSRSRTRAGMRTQMLGRSRASRSGWTTLCAMPRCPCSRCGLRLLPASELESRRLANPAARDSTAFEPLHGALRSARYAPSTGHEYDSFAVSTAHGLKTEAREDHYICTYIIYIIHYVCM